MKFTVSRPALAAALKLCASVADPKSMPILKNACMRVTGKTLTISATDLNVTVTATLAVTAASNGGIALDAKGLSAIVSKLPGDEVTFASEDNNWATVKAKRVANRLVGVSNREFPNLPDVSKVAMVSVDAASLRAMIDRTLFSVCNDETRFHLNGVLLESDGVKARMVSTDGHRLSKVDHAFAGGPELATAGVIIPTKGAQEIKRFISGAEHVKIAHLTPYLYLAVDGLTLAVKLIDAQFPPYAQVIPSKSSRVATVDRMTLLDAVQRSALMSSETRGLKLRFTDGAITLTSDDPERGDSTEEIDAEYAGDVLMIGINPKYLLDALNVMECDAVTLGMNGELDPMIVRSVGDDFGATIMPMRV